ncbi:MAG: hypothetical protein WBG69_11115 [Arcobacteraceae bacterium]|jgi:UDP-N-acetylglucosamine transferase subunit ALG13
METSILHNATSDDELLEIAKSSQCAEVLDALKHNCDNKIRRAVARNTYTSSKTLNDLLMDAVLNVSYMAVQNPNCTSKRVFGDVSNPCVQCLEDERYRNCDSCTIIQEFHENF